MKFLAPVLALSALLGHSLLAVALDNKEDVTVASNGNDDAQIEQRGADLASDGNLLPDASSIYKVIISVEDIPEQAPAQLSQRHADEKAQLLTRMSKKHGKFNEHHPRNRLLDALHSFSRYEALNRADVDRWRDHYRYVSHKQHLRLESTIHYSAKFDKLDALIQTNAALCDEIVRSAQAFYEIDDAELEAHVKANEARGFGGDKVSVSQALKHYVRDWSSSGEKERVPTYPCVLDAIDKLFPDREDDAASKPKILLPGAGLGRLGYDVAALGGLEVSINEWSMYMNVAYRHLTSTARKPSSLSMHPFLDSWSHHVTTANQLRAVPFPDIPLNASSDVLMVEGDFTTVFAGSKAHYDAVLTFFFIDTARNLMAYLDTIHSILKPGGYWVNFGPLLYGTGPFVQLSLDEIILVAEDMGFEIVEQEWDGESPSVCGVPTFEGSKKVWSKDAVYGFDEKAMTRNAYSAQFWVARKLPSSCQQKKKKGFL